MMLHYMVRAVGLNRGAPRIFLDGPLLRATGFRPGARFNLQLDAQRCSIELMLAPGGQRKTSSRKKLDTEDSVIDINGREVLRSFQPGMAVRIELYADRVLISPLASELARVARLRRLLTCEAQGWMSSASLAHGIGVMAKAAHLGFARKGMALRLVAAVELDARWIDQACERNDAWSQETIGIAAPLQEVVQDGALLRRIGLVDLVEAGLPCSGASRAGKAKRRLRCMEDHPEVGHLVAPALGVVQSCQPIAFMLENVTSYANEASAAILRFMLRDMAYDVHEVVLEATAFGAMEGRTRWFLAAVTCGIELDVQHALEQHLQRFRPPARYVGELLDPVPLDDPSWRSFAYIGEKADRDALVGNCFSPQVVATHSIEVPTLRKGYQKAGSTDPLLQHPSEPGLRRQFTVAEHARFKGVPEHLVDGLSFTAGHQALGQSIAVEPVAWLFEVLAGALKDWAKDARSNARHAFDPRPRVNRSPARAVTG
jgi:DNA (cytosine-5)-methyltransferase 1